MHLAMRILGKESSRRMMVALRVCTEPIEVEHRRVQTILKTQMGSYDYHINMSCQGYGKYVALIAKVLNDSSLLMEMGFDVDHSINDEKHPMVLDEQSLAMSVVDLIRNLMYNEIIMMMFYSHKPPMLFVSLLSKDEDEVEATLRRCEIIWRALTTLEERSLEDNWCANYLRDLAWPRTCFCREVLIALSETQFKFCPTDIKEDLEFMIRGWCSSVPCENGFNLLRASSNAHTSKTLGRASRWHRLITSPLIQDHDRKPVTFSNVAKSMMAHTLPAYLFESRSNHSSTLGIEVVTAVCSHDHLEVMISLPSTFATNLEHISPCFPKKKM